MGTATLDISEARRQLNSLDERLEEEFVIYITRHNKKAFVMVNLDYFSGLGETLEILADPEAVQMLQSSFDDIRAGRLYDQDDVEKELL